MAACCCTQVRILYIPPVSFIMELVVKFKKEDLIELLEDDHGDFKVIKNWLVDTSRWSLIYGLVFSYQDKFYETTYSCGATESQDESPFEYSPKEIECREVKPVDTVVTIYVPV